MEKRLCTSLIILFFSISAHAQKRTISGYVTEKGSSESLIGIYLPAYNIGTTTNAYGFYSITINKEDSIEIRWSFVGYQTIQKKSACNPIRKLISYCNLR